MAFYNTALGVTYTRFTGKPLYSILPINACKINPKLSKGSCQNIQEVSILRKDNRLGTRIVFSNPEYVPSNSVDFCSKRAIEVNVLDLVKNVVVNS